MSHTSPAATLARASQTIIGLDGWTPRKRKPHRRSGNRSLAFRRIDLGDGFVELALGDGSGGQPASKRIDARAHLFNGGGLRSACRFQRVLLLGLRCGPREKLLQILGVDLHSPLEPEVGRLSERYRTRERD